MARFRPVSAKIAAINAKIKKGVPLILAVGLTRPFQAVEDEAPWHWFQINNFHFADDPLWQ